MASRICPERLECFDISHSSGEATVASCVVFDSNGPLKSDYRRFNIEGIAPGDDYGAMNQALRRRYERLKSGDGRLPDLLVIDGGPGQLNQARAVLADLQVEGVQILGIAKGTTRKPGLETIYLADHGEIPLPPNSGAMHLLQHIRDEAHRFAITGIAAPRQGPAAVGTRRNCRCRPQAPSRTAAALRQRCGTYAAQAARRSPRYRASAATCRRDLRDVARGVTQHR